MTAAIFVWEKTEQGPLGTIKVGIPVGLTPNLFDPCATLAEFESALDSFECDLKKAREDARHWFAAQKSN